MVWVHFETSSASNTSDLVDAVSLRLANINGWQTFNSQHGVLLVLLLLVDQRSAQVAVFAGKLVS